MTRRLVLWVCAAFAATLAAIVGVVALTSSAHAEVSAKSVDAVTAADPSPFQTVTSYQLQWMHLFLTPAPSSVSVSSDEADQAVEAHGIAENGGPILETVLATCSMTPQPVSAPLAWANRPCWVVVVQPGQQPVVWGGVAGGSSSTSTAPLTVEYALVDANTGEVFDEAAGSPPAQAPSS